MCTGSFASTILVKRLLHLLDQSLTSEVWLGIAVFWKRMFSTHPHIHIHSHPSSSPYCHHHFSTDKISFLLTLLFFEVFLIKFSVKFLWNTEPNHYSNPDCTDCCHSFHFSWLTSYILNTLILHTLMPVIFSVLLNLTNSSSYCLLCHLLLHFFHPNFLITINSITLKMPILPSPYYLYSFSVIDLLSWFKHWFLSLQLDLLHGQFSALHTYYFLPLTFLWPQTLTQLQFLPGWASDLSLWFCLSFVPFVSLSGFQSCAWISHIIEKCVR